jgi:hypothetical protein
MKREEKFKAKEGDGIKGPVREGGGGGYVRERIIL